MMDSINETFLINVDISEENCMLEVVIFHGPIREVIKTFYGEDAKKMTTMLVRHNATIDTSVIGIEEHKISSIESMGKLYSEDEESSENKKEEEIENDRNYQVTESELEEPAN